MDQCQEFESSVQCTTKKASLLSLNNQIHIHNNPYQQNSGANRGERELKRECMHVRTMKTVR